jgi:putative ABC transport system substrate-binding protein
VDRRAFLAGSIAFLAAPLSGEAQQAGRTWRIGYLSLAPGPSPRSEALRQGLRDLGYAEGGSITIQYRWGDGSLERSRKGMKELIDMKIDVIVTGGPQKSPRPDDPAVAAAAGGSGD